MGNEGANRDDTASATGTRAGSGDGDASWWVYVLLSADGARTYVGATRDAERRLRQHNGNLAGGARSTRGGRPWRIAALHGPFAERGEAQSAESRLKRLPGRERLVAEPDPA